MGYVRGMAQPRKPDGWIIFVRHSESCANQLKAAYSEQKGIQKLKTGIAKLGYRDPELTELGEKWATLRGEQLAPYVSPTTKMFASTLFRTQLTAMFILEGIQKTNPGYQPEKIQVLPNSSEVHNISSFIDIDNAPLNPTNFVSFNDRIGLYRNQLLNPTSVYSTHPSYNQFIQTLDTYKTRSKSKPGILTTHVATSEVSHNALRANPLYSRIEEKLSQFTFGDSLFNQPPENGRKAAVESNPAKLKIFLESKNFYINASRKINASVKISGLTPIAITKSIRPMPSNVTVDHLDAIIVSHGGVMKKIIELLGGKKPELYNLDAILFRIKDGKMSAAYLMPMTGRKSAVELGISEIDKSCMSNECQGQKGGFLQKRTRRQRQRRSSTRRHRRRGREQP